MRLTQVQRWLKDLLWILMLGVSTGAVSLEKTQKSTGPKGGGAEEKSTRKAELGTDSEVEASTDTDDSGAGSGTGLGTGKSTC